MIVVYKCNSVTVGVILLVIIALTALLKSLKYMAKARLQISVINIPLFHLLLSLLLSGREFCGHVEAIKYTEVRGLHIWLFAICLQKVQGVEVAYYEVVFDQGTTCDLTGRPRRSAIQYVCQPDGHGEIYEIKETLSCEYEIVVLTSLLCSHPAYGYVLLCFSCVINVMSLFFLFVINCI